MTTTTVDRSELIGRAFLLEWLTVGWMAVEVAVAIGAGIVAHSVTLLAFGLDSVIEIASAAVLIWRLDVELRRGVEFSETAEARAGKIAGSLLFALAAYVVMSAAFSLMGRHESDFSPVGLAVTVVAIPAMYILSRTKLKIADRLGSRAMRADAMEAITCGYLALVVLVGLICQFMFHAWWVDGVTSLAIVFLLVKEGREAWQGDNCCDD